MSENRKYTEEEIEALAEQAAQNAMEHFKHGANCAECAFMGFLDLGLSDFPSDIVALASGFGGGMGKSRHACGAVTGGIMAIGTMKGRKNPFALPTFEERVDELNHPGTGIYDRHAQYLRQVVAEFGSLDCLDLTYQFEDFHSKDRARRCKKIVGFCAKQATKAALKD